MKQTAVEWLEDNLIGNPFSEKDFAHNVNVFKQAKEMEKEQIQDAYNYGQQIPPFEYAEQYYNKTYGKNEEAN
jgi:hypothetical protein